MSGNQPVPALGICTWGTARADLPQIAAMRKTPPAWSPEGTPGHFLKHADEQTVVAVAAVDRAIQAQRLQVSELRDWAVVAAPRFIGRLGGTTTLTKFSRGGGPAISPHVIPQHSLHSVSGALSILLATRAQNIGVGGGPESLTDGLFTALTLGASAGKTGIWLVCTAWDPEPIADRDGQCTNHPTCYAVALALQAAAAGQHRGQLQLVLNAAGMPFDSNASDNPPLSVAALSTGLDACAVSGRSNSWSWRLRWGASVVLEARGLSAQLPLAA
jgi:hypothetical protein